MNKAEIWPACSTVSIQCLHRLLLVAHETQMIAAYACRLFKHWTALFTGNSYPEDKCWESDELSTGQSLIQWIAWTGQGSCPQGVLCYVRCVLYTISQNKTASKTNANSADANLRRSKIQRHTLLQYLPTSTIPNKALVTPGVISNSPFDLRVQVLVKQKQNLAMN